MGRDKSGLQPSKIFLHGYLGRCPRLVCRRALSAYLIDALTGFTSMEYGTASLAMHTKRGPGIRRTTIDPRKMTTIPPH